MSKTAQDYALKGYCLWLVPSAASEPALRTLISDLAGLEPPAPRFMPHITLLAPKNALRNSASDLETALKRAASGPLKLTLEPPAPGTWYYQCVLSPVAPSRELLALRAAVEDACDWRPESFFPHLSLLYGDLGDERKRELCAEAAKRIEFPLQIDVEEAVVVEVNGTAEEWKIVSRVKL